jgi:hypothetical protein
MRLRNRAIFFCNGFRKRIVSETADIEEIRNFFDKIVDISALTKPWELGRFEDLINEKHTEIDSWERLEGLLEVEEFDFVLVVGLMGSCGKNILARSLQKHKVKWGILENRSSYTNYFLKSNIERFFRRLKNRFQNYNVFPDVIFSNNPMSLSTTSIFKRPKFIKINHRDYYHLSSDFDYVGGDYFVFLDQALPFHYSVDLSGDRSFYDKDKTKKYYETLNHYLLKVSEVKGLKVCVCLHPNTPSWCLSFFCKDFILKKRVSGIYAKNAKFLVTHFSSATSFGYILNKHMYLLDFPQIMPKLARSNIYKKRYMENLTVQVWPSKSVDSGFSGFANKRQEIVNWLVPTQDARSIISIIKDNINKLKGEKN